MGKVDPEASVLLMECANAGEAGQLRAMLESQDISCVVVAENQSSMLPHLAMLISPRVLVMQKDLERARALLSATPVLSTVSDGSSLEGAVCPVHEKQALAICARCGTFLCEECPSLGSPALCEQCLGHEEAEVKPRHPVRKVLATGIVLGWVGPIVIGLLLGIIYLLGRLFGRF